MPHTGPLAIAAARMIADGACDEVALAIVDLGGHPLLVWRSPRIGFFYSDLAAGKAWTAAALMRTPSLTGAALAERPAAAAFLSGLGRGAFAPMEGGALLLAEGVPVCGVGVAGPASGKADMALLRELAAGVRLDVHDGGAAAWPLPGD